MFLLMKLSQKKRLTEIVKKTVIKMNDYLEQNFKIAFKYYLKINLT